MTLTSLLSSLLLNARCLILVDRTLVVVECGMFDLPLLLFVVTSFFVLVLVCDLRVEAS